MATVKSPLFSLDASGTVGKAIVYSNWKGRAYVREHIIPFNPQSTEQVNLRTAFTLLVAYWQTLTAGNKASWNLFAQASRISGFNIFISRGIREYILQLTIAVTPTSVSVSGLPPLEIWTWA
jgi:hypothetical protein